MKRNIRTAFLWILTVRGASKAEGVLARATSSHDARLIVAEELEDDRWEDAELVDVAQALEAGENRVLLRAAVTNGASAKVSGTDLLFDRLSATKPKQEAKICEECEGNGCDDCEDGWVNLDT